MLYDNSNFYTIVTDDDLDGAVCALLVELAYPTSDVRKYFAGKRSDIVVNALLDDKIVIQGSNKFYITDVGVTPATASRINNIKLMGYGEFKDKVVLRDHHENSAFLNNGQYDWAFVDVSESEDKIYNECGASLLFKVLNNEIQMNHSAQVYESIIKIVNDTRSYDTWSWFEKENNDHALFLNVLFKYKGIDNFIREFKSCADRGESLLNVYSNNSGAVNGIIKLINYKHNKYIKMANETLYRKTILGYNCCVMYCDDFLSEIGNYICRDVPDIDIAVLWNYDKVGLRTNRPDINLPSIASMLGGNGRGMSASIPMCEGLIDNINNLIESRFCESVAVENESSEKEQQQVPPANKENKNDSAVIQTSLDVSLENNVSSINQQIHAEIDYTNLDDGYSDEEGLGDEDDIMSSMIDSVVQKGTDISDITTIGVSPELDWEYEKRESIRKQHEEEEILYQEFLEDRACKESEMNAPHDLDIDHEDVKTDELIIESDADTDEIQYHEEEPVKQIHQHQNPNRKKKKKIKPVR